MTDTTAPARTSYEITLAFGVDGTPPNDEAFGRMCAAVRAVVVSQGYECRSPVFAVEYPTDDSGEKRIMPVPS